MLQVNGLSFDYPEKPLLTNLHFFLAQGQLMHLQGSNGAGKTTLLKLLAGLLEPNAGEIRFKDALISHDLNTYQRALCYVGHKTGINQVLTVKENCYFDMHWGRSKTDYLDLVQGFGLEQFSDEPCYLLSAGQKRRVALIRLLMTDASLWLLDEPFIALDEKALQTLVFFLNHHIKQGGLVVLTSHQSLPIDLDYQVYSL